MTVSFGNDGKVSGTAGCNRYFSSYAASVSGETVSISALSATRMLCNEPEGIMAQEQRFLAALAICGQLQRQPWNAHIEGC
uniref:META domain-containing protein n=1 Tax=Candidatus Electronema sp. TaxID=2698783 RepID=UPI004056DBFF